MWRCGGRFLGSMWMSSSSCTPCTSQAENPVHEMVGNRSSYTWSIIWYVRASHTTMSMYVGESSRILESSYEGLKSCLVATVNDLHAKLVSVLFQNQTKGKLQGDICSDAQLINWWLNRKPIHIFQMGCTSFSDLLQQVARCRVGRADYGTSRWVVATLLLPFLNVLARLKVEMSERRQCNNTVCVSHLDKIMNCYVVKRGPNFPSPLWAMPQRKLFVDGGVPLYLKILFKTTQ